MNQRDVVRRLERPKILLLSGCISCERDEASHGYVDMEQLSTMEEEYLRSVCNKIRAFKPDLILVEKTVTQRAKEILSELGIAYVFNVRASVMTRLRRIFGTEVYSAVLSVIKPPALGSASLFEVE